jgi:hypothetical protein
MVRLKHWVFEFKVQHWNQNEKLRTQGKTEYQVSLCIFQLAKLKMRADPLNRSSNTHHPSSSRALPLSALWFDNEKLLPIDFYGPCHLHLRCSGRLKWSMRFFRSLWKHVSEKNTQQNTWMLWISTWGVVFTGDLPGFHGHISISLYWSELLVRRVVAVFLTCAMAEGGRQDNMRPPATPWNVR